MSKLENIGPEGINLNQIQSSAQPPIPIKTKAKKPFNK